MKNINVSSNNSNLININLSARSKTLLIPLNVRAKESVSKQPLFIDKMAVAILKQCDTNNITIDGGEISAHGILSRTIVIDTEIKRIIAEHTDAIVINLGAGLDTRIFRLDNGSILWYDLDLPEVIALRKQFISEQERLRFLSKSVLDDGWIDDTKTADHDTVIIIAEGVMMYFSEHEVKHIFSILVNAFPNADLFFDVVHPFFIGKKISSTFLWGIACPSEIEKLNNQISVVQSFSTGNLLTHRQPIPLRLLNWIPSTRNRSQILHIKLQK